MRVFKFGGASIKDANSVKNVVNVLQHEGTENTLVIVSAMGKMTNAFEKVAQAYFNKSSLLSDSLNFVKEFHYQIIEELFNSKKDIISKEVELLFKNLLIFMDKNSLSNYNYVYDQIVPYGELLSTKIVSAYLNKKGIKNNLLDVRKLIKTDNSYRDAKVNWAETEKTILDKTNTSNLNITQGFLGGYQNHTTTLGREGSDYTAGIFAYCLNAKSVTIWKDVDGVLNADPRVFTKTQLLEEISYTEAIEMAFYGASVIHPKTIQPLEQKNIPLYVRSFTNISNSGTCVGKGNGIYPKVPCFIVKKNQTLISVSAKDFSFMVESNISAVFKKLHEHKLKVNLIQNSAISFSVCVNDKFGNFTNFCNDLQSDFNIKTYHNVTLFTIRHFSDEAIQTIQKKGKAVIKQINTETAQLVVQEG